MKTFQQVASDYPQFTEEECRILRLAMENTWGAIGAECIPFMDDENDDSHVVELIVDADRMTDYGGGWGDPEEVALRKSVITRFYKLIREDYKLYPDLPMAIWQARWR